MRNLTSLAAVIASVTIVGQAHALTLLGTGAGALRGGKNVGGVVQRDLTNPGFNGDENQYNLHTGGTNTGNFRGVFFSSDEPGFGGGEFAFNVFDDQVGGGNAKWCCGTSFPQVVGTTLPQQHVLSSFTVTSGNDTPGRDPVVWRMEGSNDGTNFSTIYSGSAVWTARNQVALFEAGTDYATPAAYNTFRMVTDQTSLVGGAFFQLNEIELFDDAFSASFVAPVRSANVALGGKAASQSSSHGAGPAGNGVDNNLGNFTHTLNSDTNPTWEVDLGATAPINKIVLHNRDNCCQGRLQNINVEVLDRNGTPVANFIGLNANNSLGNPEFLTIDLPDTVLGRTVRVTRTVDLNLPQNDDNRVLALGEVQVFAPNVALNGIVSQSSSHGAGPAGNAINDNLGDFSHTLSSDTNPTLSLDLLGSFDVDSIFLHNRDSCCQGRLQNIEVEAFDEDGNSIFQSTLLNPNNNLGNPAFLAIDFHELFGRSLSGVASLDVRRIVDLNLPQNDDNRVLSLGELQVFGTATVPEPATAMLGLAGLFALGARRRRRHA